MANSVTIRAAWIGAAALLVAAVAAGLFQLYGPSRSQQSITVPGAAGGPITMLGASRDVTINYNVPDTATREAIELLKKKAADTDSVIELTRKEFLLLSRALQDLDQRTSGLHKLPDGRTQFGHFISGEPTIVIQEHEAARQLFAAGDLPTALQHSQSAIKAYEETKQSQASMSTGDLTPEATGKMYKLATMIAQRLQRNELANEYAVKAVEVSPSPEHQAILATTLYNVGKTAEALAAINKAVEGDPNSEEYRRLRDEMSRRTEQSRSPS